MYAFVLLSFFACTLAAPQYYRPPPAPLSRFSHRQNHHDDFGMQPFFGDSVFDTPRFWSDLSSEMNRFDQLLENFMEHFPRSSSSMGYVDNQYQITITLNDFAESDIVVKAREGLVMVQAVKRAEHGSGRSYMDVRSLPSNVNVTGSWTFEHGILKVVFPLKESSSTVPSVSTEENTEATTEAPRDREEIESQESDHTNQEADVGVARGDNELSSNAVNQDSNAVEATTYAVDLTNEVEFVPVRY